MLQFCFLGLERGTGFASHDHKGQGRLQARERIQREKEPPSVNSQGILYGLKGNLCGNENWIFEPSSKLCLCAITYEYIWVHSWIIPYKHGSGWPCRTAEQGPATSGEISQERSAIVDKWWADSASAAGISGYPSMMRNVKYWNLLCEQWLSRSVELCSDVKAHPCDSTEYFLQKTLAEWEIWTLTVANIDFKEGGISSWQDGKDTSGMLELVGRPVTIKSGLPVSHLPGRWNRKWESKVFVETVDRMPKGGV